MSEGFPLNQDDVLKIVRRGKELGMTYSDFAEALQIPVKNLHSFVLRHGTLEDAIQILRELRRVPDKETKPASNCSHNLIQVKSLLEKSLCGHL